MAFNKKLRIGQIDLTDLSSSEIASAADIANVESNVTSFESTALSNVDSIQDSVDSASTNIDTVQSNLTTFEGTIDTVQDNVTSETTIVDAYGTYANSTFATQTYVDNAVSGLVSSSPTALDTLNEIAEAMGDDADIDGTLRGKIDTVQDNVTTVISSLDTVQGNLDAFAATTNTSLTSGANTSITANGEALSNTTIFLAAGAGVSLSVNSTSKTVSVDSSVSNITSQVLSVDGTANTFTLPKSASNTSMMVVFYNGLALRPSEYGVSSTTLTINNTDPLISDSELEVRYFDFFDLPGTTTSSGGGGYVFGGENYGYASASDYLFKFSLTSDSPASDINSPTNIMTAYAAGQSSDSYGYHSGGSPLSAVIDKFPFSSDTDASNIGALTQGRQYTAGQSSDSYGYTTGGFDSPSSLSDVIDKFPFSSDTNATDVGELSSANHEHSGQSSSIYGYTSSGNTTPSVYTQKVDKFSFSSDSPASNVGDGSFTAALVAGQSSSTDGYQSGGYNGVRVATVGKFPFSSDTGFSSIGSITLARFRPAGVSSLTYGYTAGGSGPAGNTDVIDKFPFSSDSNASDVGELTAGTQGLAGTQY